MEKIDLLNSYDVLSLARRWAPADPAALDLAQRMTSDEAVAAEVSQLTSSLESARQKEVFWRRVSLFGLATLVPGVLAGVLLVAGVEIPAHYLELVAGRTVRWIPILGIFFWLFVISTFGSSAIETQQHIEEQLDLLRPIEGAQDCHLALRYVQAGQPEVLAWRNIAVRDRKILRSFDVAVMRALHLASMAARTAEEMTAATEAARQQLYGDTPAPSA